MTTAFARLAPRLQEAIVRRLGWTSLRPVQELAGHALLDGHNAVVLAPTAGGKTEASMFPVLSGLVDAPARSVGALYIAPIKALLNNQAERLGVYTEMIGLRRFVWHGDVGSHERRQFLRDPAELLMTTPESLEVMLVSQRVDAGAVFGDLRCVIIDEVHALAGSDRGAHLLSVIERIAKLSRHDVQRVGLSATVGNPDAILRWLQGTSARPGVVVDPPKEPGRRELLVVYRRELNESARHAALMARGRKSLFFCQSRATSEAVAEAMARLDINVFVHHSAVSAEERARAEEQFHRGDDACIVCTSTLELGIDVGDLDRVLQSDAPDTVGSFLQRMGRTGRRAGQSANTTFFCESSMSVVQSIALIELAKRGWVESIDVDDRCWPVLIHQLLAMSLAREGIAALDAWEHLSRVPDFAGIGSDEFDRLIEHLVADDTLRLAGGALVLGPQAERRFGRRNFMELFAVFSTPKTYLVVAPGGVELGTLSQTFVDQLVDQVSSFLLGGRPWAVMHVSHDDRRVFVEPSPRGKRPTWGGLTPQYLSRELCEAMRAVFAGTEMPPYLEERAAEVLTQARDELADALVEGTDGLLERGPEIEWWTFAGGRINATLKHALRALHADWTVVPDNLHLRVSGEGVSLRAVREAIARLRDPAFWDDAQLWGEVAEGLPSYRLSKFQPLMPAWVEREVLARYLLDVRGAGEWLG